MQVSLVHVTVVVCPFRLQPPHVPCRRLPSNACSATGFPHIFCGTGLRLSLAGSPITHGRIEFTFRLRTRHSPPAASHTALRTAQLHSVSGFYVFPRRACTSLTCYTPRRTRVRLGGRGRGGHEAKPGSISRPLKPRPPRRTLPELFSCLPGAGQPRDDSA